MRPAPALLAATLLASTAPACIDRGISRVDPSPDRVETKLLPASLNREIDLLFVIDDSGSMREEQDSLIAAFPTLLDILDDAVNGLPDLHVGVVSSDVSLLREVPGCHATGGDDGQLRGATCPALGGNSFLSDRLGADGERVVNYTGALGDAFACMASVGTSGCGIEHHLEAMRRALDPAVNPGFRRPTALLAVVIIADEDDCSIENPDLMNLALPGFGALTDFRCHLAGVVCENDPDPSAPGPKTNCTVREPSEYLHEVSDYVAFLTGLEPDPDLLFVAAIIGDTDQLVVGLDAQNRPEVVAGCPSGGLGASEPGIRIEAMVDQIPAHAVESLCANDLQAAIADIARSIPPISACFAEQLADRNPDLAGVQPECSVVQVTDPFGPDRTETPLPMCSTGEVPCWRIVDSATCAASGQRLEIDRGGQPAPDGTYVDVQCVVE